MLCHLGSRAQDPQVPGGAIRTGGSWGGRRLITRTPLGWDKVTSIKPCLIHVLALKKLLGQQAGPWALVGSEWGPQLSEPQHKEHVTHPSSAGTGLHRVVVDEVSTGTGLVTPTALPTATDSSLVNHNQEAITGLLPAPATLNSTD